MSNGETNGAVEQTTPDTGSQLLAEGGNAAAAFVDFQAKLTQIEERILGRDNGEDGEGIPLEMGDGTEDGEEMSFEERIAKILENLLSGGQGKDGEVSPLVQTLLNLVWAYTQQQLFGEDEKNKRPSLLQMEVQKVLPSVIEELIYQEGESSNPLKTMRNDVDKLIHGLHILGDKVIPGLEQGLVDIQKQIADLQKEGIEPKGSQDKSRKSSSTDTSNCC